MEKDEDIFSYGALENENAFDEAAQGKKRLTLLGRMMAVECGLLIDALINFADKILQ